jgi:hypothetical protein
VWGVLAPATCWPLSKYPQKNRLLHYLVFGRIERWVRYARLSATKPRKRRRLFYWRAQTNNTQASAPTAIPTHVAGRRPTLAGSHERRHARSTTRARPWTQKQKPDKRHPTRQTTDRQARARRKPTTKASHDGASTLQQTWSRALEEETMAWKKRAPRLCLVLLAAAMAVTAVVTLTMPVGKNVGIPVNS